VGKLCQIKKQKTGKGKRCLNEKASLNIKPRNEGNEKMPDVQLKPIKKEKEND